ncbi:MAG: exo-alpha-sialidase, partial [Gemmatimonadetes bacterium]|nr:exo-alpha-sialidase [Gemmatimonadota bacterium]
MTPHSAPKHRALGSLRAVVGALALAAACDRAGPAPAFVPLENPAPDGSAQASLTVGPDGRAWLSWLERGADSSVALKVVAREGAAWGPVREVVRGRDLLVNWADIPRVAALDNGRLVAGWLRGSSVKEGYDLLVASSSDAGATWSAGVPAHHDGLEAEHGFVSFFPQGDHVGLVWLDGRNYQLADTARHETQLMYATMDEHGAVGREFAIDDRICDCCQTAAAVAAGQVAVVAYRDRSKDEVRDIYVKRIAGNVVSTGVPVHNDHWSIHGCPVNGPSVSAAGATVALAWFTAPNDTPHVRLAFSRDTGRTFGAPVEVHDGRAEGRVTTALLPDGDALVAWVETRGETSVLRVRRVRPDGTRGAAAELATLSGGKRASGFARLVVAGREALIASGFVAGYRGL